MRSTRFVVGSKPSNPSRSGGSCADPPAEEVGGVGGRGRGVVATSWPSGRTAATAKSFNESTMRHCLSRGGSRGFAQGRVCQVVLADGQWAPGYRHAGLPNALRWCYAVLLNPSWIDPMSPIDLHFRVVALLREVPTRRRGNLIARGVAWHDGDLVELRGETNDQAICVVPDDLVDRAMPVTGTFCAWYPGADFYIVCGDRDIPGLGRRSN